MSNSKITGDLMQDTDTWTWTFYHDRRTDRAVLTSTFGEDIKIYILQLKSVKKI